MKGTTKQLSGGLLAVLAIFVSCVGCSIAQEHVIRFHSADRQTIVRTHNDLRRSIYNAANMRELTWNPAVAHAAAEWGQKCEYISRPDNQWGQNMNYFYGNESDRPAIELFQESFKGWSDDRERMQYDYRRYRYCGRKHVCSYVQLIAADVQEVGCAIATCPRLYLREPEGVRKDAKLLVCFYTPWVNIVGSEVFIPQKRCDACPPGTTCVDFLCSARFGASFSGNRPLPSLSAPAVDLKIEDKSGSRDTVVSGNLSPTRRGHRTSSRRRYKQNTSSGSFGEHRRNPDAYAREPSLTDTNSRKVIYTPNNRVVPFPGREESRDVRRVEKQARRRQRKKEQQEQAELVESPAAVEKSPERKDVTITVTNKTLNGRTKRQVDSRYYDVRYLRRLEYERHLRERQRRIRERYEEDRRRTEEARRREEERRLLEEQRRQHIERQNSIRRAQALTLGEGELKGDEQFFIISAHNLLRQEVGARDLAWNSHLERWARYVIRCDIEYPGPITCHTNFGKAEPGQEIYNVVYNWGAEGNDVNRPLRYGCRTPRDRSSCNHNTIIRNPALTQMACAALKCGSQRQLTCIYNDS